MVVSRSRRIGIHDVARLAGVSRQTVSRVINDSPDVAPQTRVNVLNAIEQLHYHPNQSARALVTRQSNTLGIIVGENQEHTLELIAAFESVAQANSKFVSMSVINESLCTQRDMDDLYERYDEQNVDAIAVVAFHDTVFNAAVRARSNKPRVIITATEGITNVYEARTILAKQNDLQNVSLIASNEWRAMHDMVDILVHRSHRSALYIAGPQQWRDAFTRLQAFKTFSNRARIASQVITCSTWQSSESYARMNHMLERCGMSGQSVPSVIMCASDVQAVGVMRSLYEHGYHIPSDVSLIGWADMASSADFYPPLSTVNTNLRALGSLAAREAIRLVRHDMQPVLGHMIHGVGLVPANLVLRSSLSSASH